LARIKGGDTLLKVPDAGGGENVPKNDYFERERKQIDAKGKKKGEPSLTTDAEKKGKAVMIPLQEKKEGPPFRLKGGKKKRRV